MAVAFTLATPLAPVTAVAADKVALAPDAGAVKFTVTPGTGFDKASETVTESAVAKGCVTGAVCVRPPEAMGEPAEQTPGSVTAADCAALWRD